jgi:hypothetical protein
MATFPILTADGDTIVTADGFAVVISESIPPTPPGTGSLIVPADNSVAFANAAVFSPVDGTIIATPLLSKAEVGACLSSGIMCLLDETGTGYHLWAADYSLIGTAAPAAWAANTFSPVSAFNPSTFYVAEAHPTLHTTRVTTISDAAVVGGTIWTLPASIRVTSIAVSLDSQTLYYTVKPDMKRYDLIGLAPLTDLFSIAANLSFTFDMYVLPDGSLLVCVVDNTTKDGEVRQYSAAGALLQTFALGTTPNAGSVPFMAVDTSGLSFWVRTFPDVSGTPNTYYHYRISDGSLLHSFSADNTNGSGEIPFSCPLFVTGATSEATTFPIRRMRRWMP